MGGCGRGASLLKKGCSYIGPEGQSSIAAMTPKEVHPFLDKYPLNKSYRHLLIGTIPPAKEVPIDAICKDKKASNRNFKLDYFYGNVGALWDILEKVYPSSLFKDIESIQEWQNQYSIGITDTVKYCRRKDPCSSKDIDLIVEWGDYNHSLKEYILANHNIIETLIFTSGENRNNALFNFKMIMGKEYDLVARKVIPDLPPPSQTSNLSYFNSDDATLGLKSDLYKYLIMTNNQADIDYVKNKWRAKQAAPKGKIVSGRTPKGLLPAFKVWKYKQVFPSAKRVD